MAMGEKVLRKKAKKRELKGSQKNKLILEQIPALEELLRGVYVICRPKESDYYNRKDLVRIFNVIAKEIYGKSDDIPVVEQFGSFLMDIFSAKSDLDLSVNFSNNTVDFPKEKKIQTLRKFAKKLYALQRKGHVSSVHPILTAKVPILKIVDRGTGIECDISIENRDGIVKSQIVRLISSIDDRFQMLSFLMKTWAKAQDINSSKDRTMNSLSIILLVAFHLQTRDPPILPPFSAIFKDGTDPVMVGKIVNNFLDYGKRNKESLGELFVTLLNKLLSVETLWAKGLCASTYEGSWILKTWDSKIGCISVEDFTDRSQNVARAVGKKQVKKIYECIHLCMHYVFNFMNGKIEGTKLRELLFGRELLPAPVCTTKIDKRTVEPCIQTKKRRRNECSGETDGAIPVKTKKIPSGEGWEGTTPTSGWEGTLPTTVLGGKPPTTGWGGTPPTTGRGGTPPMKGWGGAPPTISWGGAPRTNGWGGTPPTTGWGGTTTTKGSGATPPTTVWGGTPPMKAWGGTPPTTGWGGTQPTNGCGATQPTNGWGGTLPTTGLGGTPHTKGWGGTLPTTGWGGTTPTKGWGGTQPVTGLGGTQPTNGWGGTQLAKGWGGTQPTTGLGGTPHRKGWGRNTAYNGFGWNTTYKRLGEEHCLQQVGVEQRLRKVGVEHCLPLVGEEHCLPLVGEEHSLQKVGEEHSRQKVAGKHRLRKVGVELPTEGWGGTPSVGWGGNAEGCCSQLNLEKRDVICGRLGRSSLYPRPSCIENSSGPLIHPHIRSPQKPPLGFDGSHSTNEMVPMPPHVGGTVHAHAPPGRHQISGHRPPHLNAYRRF